jgi:hypothetical protein
VVFKPSERLIYRQFKSDVDISEVSGSLQKLLNDFEAIISQPVEITN